MRVDVWFITDDSLVSELVHINDDGSFVNVCPTYTCTVERIIQFNYFPPNTMPQVRL